MPENRALRKYQYCSSCRGSGCVSCGHTGRVIVKTEVKKAVASTVKGGWHILYSESGEDKLVTIEAESGGEALKKFREMHGQVKIITIMDA